MTYRAGIIGAGGIAGLGILGMHDPEDIGEKKFTASHAGGYEAAEGIDLAAVADDDEERLDTFGEAWEIPSENRYVGHGAMLESEDLDVVSVCTPSYLHHRHVVDAAESAADPDVVWCEKPVASSVSDAEEMVEVCEERDVELRSSSMRNCVATDRTSPSSPSSWTSSRMRWSFSVNRNE